MNIEISYERNRTRYQPELHIFIKPREPIDDFRHVVGEDNEKNMRASFQLCHELRQ